MKACHDEFRWLNEEFIDVEQKAFLNISRFYAAIKYAVRE